VVKHAVAAPPELEPLAGLFLPCLVRARALAHAARHARGALLDLGGAGSAAEIASRLAGVESAGVVGGPFDGVAMAALCAALRHAGIAVQRGDASGEPAAARPATSWLLVQAGTEPPRGGVVFVEHDRCLRRAVPGAAGSIPAWVEAIHFVEAGEAPGSLGRTDLVALSGWERADEAQVLTTCRLLVAHAPGRARLLAPSVEPPRGRLDGATWATRYRIHMPAVRARLARLVDACFPQHHDRLTLALCLYDLGIDALEEAFAGNGIADRNRELVANLRR
jgi:hypothetical protein